LDGAAEEMTIAAGTKLGRYEIRSKLGEGGMGEVYPAKHKKLRRRVAIKFLPSDSIPNKQAISHCLRKG
jgi:serine/threonine protein kinase